MDALTRKRPATTASLSNTTHANPNALKSAIKRGIILLALWRILPPSVATWMLRRWGLSDA